MNTDPNLGWVRLVSCCTSMTEEGGVYLQLRPSFFFQSQSTTHFRFKSRIIHEPIESYNSPSPSLNVSRSLRHSFTRAADHSPINSPINSPFNYAMPTSIIILESFYTAKYLIPLLVSVVAWQSWNSWYRLSQFRGPFWASVTNLWMANSVAHRRAHLDLFDVSEKYGKF
jgi:hypothetical protein